MKGVCLFLRRDYSKTDNTISGDFMRTPRATNELMEMNDIEGKFIPPSSI